MRSIFRTLLYLVLSLLAAALLLLPEREIARPPYRPDGEPVIHLYGEYHGRKRYFDTALRVWQRHYEEDELRHLFIEAEYYTAQVLNLWMREEDDALLDLVIAQHAGTYWQSGGTKEFYRGMKAACPQTVFHGTDIGHIRETGEWYLTRLREQGLEGSPEYLLTLECLAQGERYYAKRGFDEAWREERMAQNFISAYEALGRPRIAGIYGDAHADPSDERLREGVPCMAAQLRLRLGDIISYESLVTLSYQNPCRSWRHEFWYQSSARHDKLFKGEGYEGHYPLQIQIRSDREVRALAVGGDGLSRGGGCQGRP